MIGERLKQARIKLGITQKSLAQKLNITPSAVSMYENGNRLPSMEIFIKLIDILSISADEVLGHSISVMTNSTNYTISLAKEDLKIIKEIKKYDNLYKRLCTRTEDIIAMLNKKIG
jgi:transcriptional regulator with XRE-family HTH domain